MSFTLKKIVLPVTMAFCAISASAATYTQTVPDRGPPPRGGSGPTAPG